MDFTDKHKTARYVFTHNVV